MSATKNPAVGNQLLAALPRKYYQDLQRHLEETPLVLEEILYQPNVPISDVYFPNSGIVSLLGTVNDHASLEVGLVGSEGMLGLPIFMGVATSQNRAVVQGVGTAMRMKASTFRRECTNGSELPPLLQRYSHSLLTQITQSAVCNQFHMVEARLARWLLMTRDRMGSDQFQLTQKFLSNMLGVRREGVTRAAGALQKRKLIAYSRGTLRILDGRGLEATSCGCYEIIRSETLDARPRKK